MRTTDVPILELVDVLSELREVPIIEAVLRDPTNMAQVRQLTNQLQSVGIMPTVVRKLQNVGNMLVTFGSPTMTVPTKSYTATVRMLNQQPLSEVNRITVNTRHHQLREGLQQIELYQYVPNGQLEYRSIRPALLNNLLPKCINAMGDLSLIIRESSEANGSTVDDFIKSNLARAKTKYALPSGGD